MMNQIFEKMIEMFNSICEDEERRQKSLFNLLNLVLGNIALVMTIVNLITGETQLMYATLAFTIICLTNFGLHRYTKTPSIILHIVFSAEVLLLLGYFIVSGHPQGFSLLWTLVVPSFAMAIFGVQGGGILSVVTFLMVVFFFWTPWGRALLQYPYSETYLLRFPFVYICMVFIAVYLEAIRRGTFAKMKESEKNFKHLYRHDALTGLCSRHAFYEELERIFQKPSDEHVAILIFDIDDFKRINDRYGHNVGDEVLCRVASIIEERICEHCIACRWGGEEFLVLMQCRHEPGGIAESIRKAVETSTIQAEGEDVRFTVSAGISTAYTLDKSQVSEFISRADKAMYLSKTNGKNQVTSLPL